MFIEKKNPMNCSPNHWQPAESLSHETKQFYKALDSLETL